MNIKHVIASFFLFMLCTGAQAAVDLDAPIAVGPQVTKGVLPNGLTYYIHKNGRPAQKVELRLVVNAGSVLEDDDQQGLAHFVEHMAFNGSTHFQKHELISYLQSIGLKFGADLNAYTGFNETVYQLTLPTTDPKALKKGFLVLEDWAHGLNFKDTDIDAERSIIIEELRLRKGAQDRMMKTIFPKMFAGSKYADRLPIGHEAGLRTFPYSALKRFYNDWYRPNLMAVVIVGDIEPSHIESLVHQHFDALKNPEHERPRNVATIAPRTETEAITVTDPEETSSTIQIAYSNMPAQPSITLRDYRNDTIETMFNSMLGGRIQELTQQAKPPFIAGSSLIGKVMPGYKAFGTQAALSRQGISAAVNAMLNETERVRLYGFTSAELERTKINYMTSIEQAYIERDKTESMAYASEYIRNFLTQESIPGIVTELAYNREFVPTITVEEVNAYARQILPSITTSKLIVYTGLQSPEAQTPTPASLVHLVKQAEQNKVTNREEEFIHKTLMPQLPKAGSIISKTSNAKLGITTLRTSNGLNVILKPTTFKDDQIVMSATRFGGQSLFDEKDMYSASYATGIIGAMGLSDYNPIQLQKMLTGKNASAGVALGAYTESIAGGSTQHDLETMLQMLYLRFQPARVDPELFESFISRSQDSSSGALARPEAIFMDAMQTTMYSGHPRVLLTAQPEHFTKIELPRVTEIYNERFQSAKNFDFIFVGNFTVESITPFIETYIASLPVVDVKTAYRDLGIRPTSKVIKQEIHRGSEAKSLVTLSFQGEATYTELDQMRLNVLTEILNLRIVDVLREKLTLIYSGGASGTFALIPYSNYRVGISLPCAPENVNKVIEAMFNEIKALQLKGPTQDELDKVLKNWEAHYDHTMIQNEYWLGRLQFSTLYGTHPESILDSYELMHSISTDDIKSAAIRYLSEDHYVQGILAPVPMKD